MPGFMTATALVAGLLCHSFILNRGEHHMFGTIYIRYTMIAAAFSAGFLLYSGLTWGSALLEAGTLVAVFLAGVTASTVAYRAFLSPLNKFPGSFPDRISSFWLSFQSTKRPVHRIWEELHKKHGDFVRVRPNGVSVAHQDGVEALYGAKSKCVKADFYDGQKPVVSLQNTRSKTEHRDMRRTWGPAFSEKALRGYETSIQTVRTKLLAILDTYDGKPVDVEHWISLYSYDVMGEMAFGKSYNGLDSKQRHWAIKTTAEGMQVLSLHLPIWFFRAVQILPGLMDNFHKMVKYNQNTMLERRNKTPEMPDVMSFLLAPYEGKKELSQAEMSLLTGNAGLLIVAGSDTTAMTITAALMLLAQHPEEAAKLRAELAPRVPAAKDEEVWHKDVVNLPHLDGIIWEVLRLYPAVPTSPPRLSPPEGITIAGTYIPGDTELYCPGYVLGRKESIYPQAEAFIPERWYKYPELVKDKNAWAPFLIGPYNCIGKPLALQNVRLTLARLVMRYDISFAPSSTPNDRKAWDAALKENFTWAAAPLNLCLKRRE